MADENAFQHLVFEAVQACGHDVTAVENYVQDKLGSLEPTERERLQRDIQRVLGFCEPPGPPYEVN